jgi:hypothetical protein
MNRAWLRNHPVRTAAVPLTVVFFAFFFQLPPSSNNQLIAVQMSLVFVNATVQELETGAPVADLAITTSWSSTTATPPLRFCLKAEPLMSDGRSPFGSF